MSTKLCSLKECPAFPLLEAKTYAVFEHTKDGQSLLIRAIRPDDKTILREGMHHLSKNSLYARFFTFKKDLTDDELKYFTEVDFADHVGLLASIENEDGARPVGVGRYIVDKSRPSEKLAELAFTIDEEYQGIGIGSLLMQHLIFIARANGIEKFIAYVMPENRRMQNILLHAGLPAGQERQKSTGVLEITLTLT